MGLIKTYQNTIFLILFTAFGALFASCGKSGASGELVGVGVKIFKATKCHMVWYIFHLAPL